MRESTGQVVFINSHDYVSDVTLTDVVGCMATLKTDDGTDVVLYTGSLRLQHTLEMVFATKQRVTVDYHEAEKTLTEQQRLIGTARGDRSEDKFQGPFDLKALWTLM